MSGSGAALTHRPVEVEAGRRRRRAVEAEEKVDDQGVVGHGDLDPVIVAHLIGRSGGCRWNVK